VFVECLRASDGKAAAFLRSCAALPLRAFDEAEFVESHAGSLTGL